MYRNEDPIVKTKLGGMQFARYPFTVDIRKMAFPEEAGVLSCAQRACIYIYLYIYTCI